MELEYEFDAPQFVDFRHERSDDETAFEQVNKDGYFVERPSDMGHHVPAQEEEDVVKAPMENQEPIQMKSASKRKRRSSSRRSSRQSLLPVEVAITAGVMVPQGSEPEPNRRQSRQSILPTPAAEAPVAGPVSDDMTELRMALEQQPMLRMSVAPQTMPEPQEEKPMEPSIRREEAAGSINEEAFVSTSNEPIVEEAQGQVESIEVVPVAVSAGIAEAPSTASSLQVAEAETEIPMTERVSQEGNKYPDDFDVEAMQEENNPTSRSVDEIPARPSSSRNLMNDVELQELPRPSYREEVITQPSRPSVPRTSDPLGSQATSSSSNKLRDLTNVRTIPSRLSVKDGKKDVRLSASSAMTARRQSIVPPSNVLGSGVKSRPSAQPTIVMSVSTESSLAATSAAQKLRSVVAETDAMLTKQKEDIPSVPKVEEPAKFRGTWMPRVADPTPISYIPAVPKSAMQPRRIGGGGSAFQPLPTRSVEQEQQQQQQQAVEEPVQTVVPSMPEMTVSAQEIPPDQPVVVDPTEYASSPPRTEVSAPAEEGLKHVEPVRMTMDDEGSLLEAGHDLTALEQSVIEDGAEFYVAVQSTATSSIGRLEEGLKQEQQQLHARRAPVVVVPSSQGYASQAHMSMVPRRVVGAMKMHGTPKGASSAPRQPPVRRPGSASSELEMIQSQSQYRVKTLEEARGRSNVPGYMTPTESSKVKSRDKLTPMRPGTPPARAPSPSLRRTPTQPREFNLATSARQRSNSGQLVSSTTRELERIRQERLARQEERQKQMEQVHRVMTSTSSAHHSRPTLTMVQPFESMEKDTRKRMEQQQQTKEYHSTVEIAQNIFRRDIKPRALSSSDALNNSGMMMPTDGHPMQPQSPQLRVLSRTRPTLYKSSEEMEYERVQMEIEEEKRKKEQQRLFMERSLNASSVSVESSTRKLTLTQPMPFELESIHRHERAQQELRMQEERKKREEEQKRQFRARPVPVHVIERPVVPRVAPVPEPTMPVAPLCVERAMYAEQLRLNKLEMEMREQERVREFHARPLPKTTYERGFSPALCETPLVEPEPPALRTDERAERRALLEQARREQEQMMEEDRRERERQAKLKEEEELREYRKNLVHRPLPVPNSSRFSSVYEMPPAAEVPRSARRLSVGSQQPGAMLGGGPHRVVNQQLESAS